MRILQVVLLSNDLVATAEFYTSLLQSKPLWEGKTAVIFTAGHSQLRFILSEVRHPVYHFAFNIPQNRLQEALEYVAELAELFPVSGKNPVANFSAWNAEAFYFYDNNGNILEFIARHDLNNSSERKFDGRSVLSVSEIALVTEDVRGLAKDLITKTGISIYEEQPLLDNFGALGNAEGLLILSKTDRNWYPTEIPAGKFRCELKCKVGEVQYELCFE